MFIIDVDTVKAIRQKLNDPAKKQEVIGDVKKMVEIKETLHWRSNAMSSCCGSLGCITSQLGCEIDALERTLAALEKNDTKEAARLLEDYEHILAGNKITA
jgi:hypothetical protein